MKATAEGSPGLRALLNLSCLFERVLQGGRAWEVEAYVLERGHQGEEGHKGGVEVQEALCPPLPQTRIPKVLFFQMRLALPPAGAAQPELGCRKRAASFSLPAPPVTKSPIPPKAEKPARTAWTPPWRAATRISCGPEREESSFSVEGSGCSKRGCLTGFGARVFRVQALGECLCVAGLGLVRESGSRLQGGLRGGGLEVWAVRRPSHSWTLRGHQESGPPLA